VPAGLDRPITADGLIAPDHVLSRAVLWRPQLRPLAVGQAIELVEHRESRLLASVKAAWPIRFLPATDVAAYAARRGGDLPPSERGAVATVEQFLASAQNTVDHASGHTVAIKRGEVEFRRRIDDGDEVIEMRAVVIAMDNLKAYLKTYERTAPDRR
jgi:hypothetical protein